ncbi:hypothetical protein EZ449_13635 [Pedobacter frigidisoli]|uniref:MetA-pathway of phenol degradation n=1 Tax=Pedobacter frigidisoli TaxID=2530455 RepID=A0A4R0NYR2_9SPHI|nr:hypothetical protein [Pedobacter frigidisoli]TCD07579.1 hypothetical protein EZ449_13635 [Pedobacter frigidisoli]
MFIRSISLSLTAIFLMCIFQEAHSSGFPTGKRKTLLSPYLSYFVAKSYRDLSGNKFNYGNGGKYSSFTAQLYLEHGITDRLDFVLKMPLSTAQFKDDFQGNKNTSLTDLELGFKYNFLKFNKDRYFLTAQGLASIPLYGLKKNPVPGYGQFGTEFKLMFSGLVTEKAYFNLEGGYRHFFGGKGDIGQLTYLATSGIKIGKNNQIMGELSGVSAYRSSLFDPENLASNTQFTFLKATLGIGQRIVGDNWIYAGPFHDILNRNSGIGQGVMVMGIFRF